MSEPTGPPQSPEPRRVPAGRLLATLTSAGLVAGTLIVFVFRGTQPAIQAYKAKVLRLAIEEVLKAPARYDTLYVLENALTKELANGVDPRDLEQVYVGYTAEGRRIGFAVVAGEPGFQDMINLIFGYDPTTGQLLGMKVLENKETPGLGDNIEKDSTFVSQFEGAEPPLEGVKARGAETAADEIDMITGATISSRTVIKIINDALERFRPLIETYRQANGP